MLIVTQTKPINQIIPVSQLKKKQTSGIAVRNKSKKNNQIVIVIVGDSIVSDTYRWELSDNNEKDVVKYFSESTKENMMTYIKPLVKLNPDRFTIHVGPNDLGSNQDPNTIARNVPEVANNGKPDTNKELISSIVPRRDNLIGKGRQVNIFLKKFCVES